MAPQALSGGRSANMAMAPVGLVCLRMCAATWLLPGEQQWHAMKEHHLKEHVQVLFRRMPLRTT